MRLLSEHFTLAELTATSSHPELQDRNQIASQGFIPSLENLCFSILEPLRAKFGAIKVNSGFRSSALNEAVKGSPTSQHCFGEAADVNCAADPSDEKRLEMALWLKRQHEAGNVKFGQALLESGCLHVSLPGKHEGQVGRAAIVAGKWTVTPLEDQA